MLKEIRCDEFKSNGIVRPAIQFHSGLNTIQGSDTGTNSIGKSTFLMIVDFVFGGDDYVKKSIDVLNHVGNHTIQFAFEFDGEIFYFTRDTENHGRVNRCADDNYEKQDDISVDEYCKFLMEKYGIDLPGLSFRAIVSGYARIYHRENYNENRPLEIYRGEAAEKGIDRLLKLFNRYAPIATIKEKIAHLKGKREALKQAKKYSYVPQITTQRQYKQNKKELEEVLYPQLKELTSGRAAQMIEELGADEEMGDAVFEIKRKLTAMRRQRSRLQSQLRMVEENIKGNMCNPESGFDDLLAFFPQANIKKITEIESFHSKLYTALASEFEQEKARLSALIDWADNEIRSYEREIEETGIPENLSQKLWDKYSEVTTRIRVLEEENRIFEETNALKADIKENIAQLAETQGKEMSFLQADATAEMSAVNRLVYEDKTAPVLTISQPNSYRFETPNDDGTGAKFKGLLVFDISILELTSLPILVHDSILFANISYEAMEKVLDIYKQKTKKQIIIAIDKAPSYTALSQEIIQSSTILKLSGNGNELFGRSWNIAEQIDDSNISDGGTRNEE